MNIKFIPTYILILYKERWNLMFAAAKIATYKFTPPYTLAEINNELKARKEKS